MPVIFATLFGAIFTLATAYALGALLMRKRAAPPEIVLGIGAATESVLVFLLLLCHLAHWGAFLALGAAAILAALRFRGAAPRRTIPFAYPSPVGSSSPLMAPGTW